LATPREAAQLFPVGASLAAIRRDPGGGDVVAHPAPP
jgi:hypothetical protein